MSDRRNVFTVGDRARVEAATTSGDITVATGDPGEVEVVLDGSGTEEYSVEQRGDVITITPQRRTLRRFGTDLLIRVPPRASLQLSSASGDVTVTAAIDDVEVKVASGDVRIGDVGATAVVRAASGAVQIGDVVGHLDVATASGTVRAAGVGRTATVKTASGDVWIDRVGERAEIKSASGRIDIGSFDGTDLSAKTMSGDLWVGIPPHRVLDLDLSTVSGDLRNQLPVGDGSPAERSAMLTVKTVSGDVTLRGA